MIVILSTWESRHNGRSEVTQKTYFKDIYTQNNTVIPDVSKIYS